MNLYFDWSHTFNLLSIFVIWAECKFLRCCWKLFPWWTSHLSRFYNTSVHICYINSSVWQEPEGLLSSFLLSCQGSHIQTGQRAVACHESVHIGCIPFYSKNVNKHVVCRACIVLEGNLLADIMNAHYITEKSCSLISFDPEPSSIYFTYETLILVLIKCWLNMYWLHILHLYDVEPNCFYLWQL